MKLTLQVHISDFRVIAHYPLPATDARSLLYALTAPPPGGDSLAAAETPQDEVLVYVHGFLTPFNNAVRQLHIFFVFEILKACLPFSFFAFFQRLQRCLYY